MRQLRVSVWDVLVLLRQGQDDVAELTQRAIDVISLVRARAGLRQLTSRQIDEVYEADKLFRTIHN